MALARAGDDQAFAELIEPYVRELQVHCYRILGSAHDAEDALQEALLSAWRGLAGFEERASLRSWLYRITTNRCLQTLRAQRRRSRVEPAALDIEPPEPTRANGQPAFGFYVHSPHGEVGRATGLLVLTLSGDRISVMTHFGNNVLPGFGLPRMFPR